MDAKLFEELLARPESVWLDFKRDQYKFTTDFFKAELLKDILGFANARRDREAFIVTGVQERKGRPHELVGIAPGSSLDDAALQQFVNKKTNRTIDFSYSEFGHRGLTFGVVRIPVQDGRRWLENDFEKLRRLYLYARTGTSIEPLTPDQIYDLGAAEHADTVPSLAVGVYDWEAREAAGADCEVELLVHEKPDPFPTLADLHIHPPPKRGMYAADPYEDRFNPAFCEQAYHYLLARDAFFPFTLSITNASSVTATDVRVELAVSEGDAIVLGRDRMPDEPRLYLPHFPTSGVSSLPALLKRDRTPEVHARADPTAGAPSLSTDPVKVQPGQTFTFANPVFIGSASGGAVKVAGHVFADNLPSPVPVELVFRLTVSRAPLDPDRLSPIEFQQFPREA